MLVSYSKDRLASWKQGLDGLVSQITITEKLDAIRDDVARIKPHALLIDFELLGLNGSNGAAVANVKRLSAETKIIILCDSISEDVEWEMIKLGVRGCCQSNIKPELLRKVVVAVQQGELWIRRTLTGRLIDELGRAAAKNKSYQASRCLLDRLTEREYDIALRVGTGESNKQIAKECSITERTVKAHLTEIYIKLGITDRIHLALILSADGRYTRINATAAASTLKGMFVNLGNYED